MSNLLRILPLLTALVSSGCLAHEVLVNSLEPASFELAAIVPPGNAATSRHLDVAIDRIQSIDPATLRLRFVLQRQGKREILAVAALFGATADSVQRLRISLPENYVGRPGDRLLVELDTSQQPTDAATHPSVRIHSVEWVPEDKR